MILYFTPKAKSPGGMAATRRQSFVIGHREHFFYLQTAAALLISDQ